MKIIGKNSISKYIGYFLFFLFAFFLFQFVYEIIGYAVSYYNYKTNNHILSDFFIIGTDVGWAKNKWTAPMDNLLKFKFYFPFTKQNMVTGIFNMEWFIDNMISGAFFTLFFYTSYKVFREISKDTVFNKGAIIWLKRFGWTNIIFTSLMILHSLTTPKGIGGVLYSAAFFMFLGILILFVVEFFKKGHQLESENELTI
ncbi:DUF2975 domain-containing protein [Elizabethkingia meningoseptica]|uniref:DUF2975 domain-containing protein n=1 Tax=Elizabethkingia meningoseptica TaxID=238 RepID=A0A1T3I9V9_ELIME|nr:MULTISPECIES: DUF2975 domain-containing protein [Elizabethkingia]AQX11518.1 hypothetical protein BBD35_03590 [Elizabethkingia meningoseptica]MBG0512868.1 DUF2975 domain-containing protein [Elizabethkingia meningoseptica]MDE5435470.1 DUF2975 domain-containing protein [Elizabethkingia meningoseptica]MDE5439309.1 DUF2975 domain-containing protein [Elizabethkingia meningoseptica]MDE5449119.1 DUF2975 domain-containing protein [Elizabethkingia meningoseptica]